ncbi:MAG TPA: NAD(P)-dependent oxidoreductase, partial [Woeseiaceae bacterium]
MSRRENIVLVTGVAGGIGSRVAKTLEDEFCVLGMDLDHELDEHNFAVDLRSDQSVSSALRAIRERFGSRLACVVHLAAYFDFSGEDNPLYKEVNVDGTRRLLEGLQDFQVEHFLYSSTMLVHKPTRPGIPITEDSPLGPAWQYPLSKLRTEETIEQHHGAIPYTLLRIAGVYDNDCNVPTLAHQIQRIYERRLQGHLFAGDPATGQSFVHRDDVIDAICRAIRYRARLRDTPALLIGEPTVMSYEELQNVLARLIHGENWLTRVIPKPLAKLGAWLQQ